MRYQERVGRRAAASAGREPVRALAQAFIGGTIVQIFPVVKDFLRYSVEKFTEPEKEIRAAGPSGGAATSR
jgi:hypothetical protein